MEKKILIVYFSGASSTRKIANQISKEFEGQTAIYSIETVIKKDICITDFSAMVIGTPVYHGEPAKILVNWIDQHEKVYPKIPIMIYSTYGLGQYNTNRILAKKLVEKNLITVHSTGYRSPASDGTLLAPYIKFLFRFEKDLEKKIRNDVRSFSQKLDLDHLKMELPRFHFSSILNIPNQYAGKNHTFKIYLHEESCTSCMKCLKKCPYQSIDKDEENRPIIDRQNCENCYRCIHHCPYQALSLSKKNRPLKQLN